MRKIVRVFAVLAVFGMLAGQGLATDKDASRGAQWITLGTSGGPPIRAERSQIANALVVNGAVYLFDAGEGTLRQLAKAGLKVGQIRVLFLTHHHFDHTAEAGAIIVSRWNSGGASSKLGVIGPSGTAHLARGIAAANAPVELASFPVYGKGNPPIADTIAPVDLAKNINAPVVVYKDENVRVTAISVNHFELPSSRPMKSFPQAVAYRVEVAGRSIVYSGDTGYSANLVMLAKNADLFVCEVIDLNAMRPKEPATPEQEALYRNWERNHSSPAVVGKMAAAANVRKLVLTHFVGWWSQPNMSGFTNGLSDEYKGEVALANDLDRF